MPSLPSRGLKENLFRACGGGSRGTGPSGRCLNAAREGEHEMELLLSRTEKVLRSTRNLCAATPADGKWFRHLRAEELVH